MQPLGNTLTTRVTKQGAHRGDGRDEGEREQPSPPAVDAKVACRAARAVRACVRDEQDHRGEQRRMDQCARGDVPGVD
ncbi:hypothetical protein ABZ726_33200, partial [Streptomyces hundungensis]|uniref:hypothetical protein n=1 Tax=Streptomyces hundungensis TaxID=1077946 RepID=UPI0033CD35B3